MQIGSSVQLLCLAGLMSFSLFAFSKTNAKFVTSRDGTRIAYDRVGNGFPVIIVNGALSDRSGNTELANLLSTRLMVYNYDRRGRGESVYENTDLKPYSVQREIEDIDALIDRAGGAAYIYGKSSGAALALQAAATLGDKVKMLALYEAPYSDEPGAAAEWRQLTIRINDLLQANRHSEAITEFMKFVGTPDDAITKMKTSPAWPAMLKMAPTLAFDNAVLGNDRSVPVKVAVKVKATTLVMDGSASLETMPFMRPTAETLATSIRNARHYVVEGEAHNVSAKAIAPVLLRFFH